MALSTVEDDVVFLHPAYQRGGFTVSRGPRLEQMTHAPRYVRTERMSRWHRPRSGHRYTRPSWGSPGRECLSLWCGQSIPDLRDALGLGQPPDGEPVCATCEGRALGAGQDDTPDGLPPLVFTGRYGFNDRWCPGSRLNRLALPHDGFRVATCRVCHDIQPMRACGGPYRADWTIPWHEPGPLLVPPCPEHGWFHLVPDGPTGAVCACTPLEVRCPS